MHYNWNESHNCNYLFNIKHYFQSRISLIEIKVNNLTQNNNDDMHNENLNTTGRYLKSSIYI